MPSDESFAWTAKPYEDRWTDQIVLGQWTATARRRHITFITANATKSIASEAYPQRQAPKIAAIAEAQNRREAVVPCMARARQAGTVCATTRASETGDAQSAVACTCENAASRDAVPSCVARVEEAS